MSAAQIKSFTDLDAWKCGHELVLMIYRLTKLFPKAEGYILVDQLRRAVISVTSNIAEGFRRSSDADQRHFYTMSLASISEIQNQLLIARDLGYLDREAFAKTAELTVRISKLLQGLIKSSRRRARERPTTY